MSAIEQIESPDLKECLTRFNQKLKEINSNLDIFFDTDMCDKLTVKKKVQIELFLCYALNSLFWMHLRTIGKDPNKHSIVTEIMKVREYITKYKEIIEKDQRPIIDASAAKRFVKGALWEPKAKMPRLDSQDQD